MGKCPLLSDFCRDFINFRVRDFPEIFERRKEFGDDYSEFFVE